MEPIKVISPFTEENPFLIIYKPKGLPSAPLYEGDESALTQAVSLFPELKKVSGLKEVEHGLVHRIDTQTQGLLLIASTQKAFDSFVEQQRNGDFTKTYRALCRKNLCFPEGMTPVRESEISKIENALLKNLRADFCVESCFRSWGKSAREVRPVFEWSSPASKKKGGSVLYKTCITLLKNEEGFYSAECSITRGFRHQVRTHLCAAGFPIAGDPLYDSIKTDSDEYFFEASSLSFIHPLSGKKIDVSVPEEQL